MSEAPGADPQAVEQSSQIVEQMMRRAEEMGLDPWRVAVALNRAAPAPTEYQVVAEVKLRSWIGRSLAGRFARPS